MSLEFCRAETQDMIKYGEYVGVEDELQEFLYKNKHLFDVDVKYIYELDPYGDTELNMEQIKKVINICGSLKKSDILDDYGERENAKEVFEDLEKIFIRALECNQKIFAIGD